MNLRFVTLATVVAVLGAGCGAGTTNVATLPKLPTPPSQAGAPLSASPAHADLPKGAQFGGIEYRLGGALAPLPKTAPGYLIASPSTGARHRVASALAVSDTDHHLVFSSARSWWFDVNCEAPPGVDISGAGAGVSGTGVACALSGSRSGSAPAATSGQGGDTPGAAGPTGTASPGNSVAPIRPADLPSREAAIARARSLFASLGIDVPDKAIHVTDGTTTWFVTADGDAGGLPTIGRTFAATIGPRGVIVAARGFVGTPRKLGDYPLVDAATTGLQRLVQEEAHRPRPMIARVMPCRPDVSSRTDVGQCGPEVPEVVTITGVTLGLQEVLDKLVPVFIFDEGPNQTSPPVPAVIDSYIDSGASDGAPVNSQPGSGFPSGSSNGSIGAPTVGAPPSVPPPSPISVGGPAGAPSRNRVKAGGGTGGGPATP